MKSQIHQIIDSQINSLINEYRDDGLAGLKSAIGDRLESAAQDNSYLLVVDGRRVAGDLPTRVAIPGWSQSHRSIRRVSTSTNTPQNARMPIIVHGTRLQNGMILAVAHDSQQLVALRARLVSALLWGVMLTLLLGAAGGVLMGRAALRRVENINRVARRIIDGELSRRVPESPRDDEFDHLAMHLNRMLDQIEGLMSSMRQVSSDIAHDLRTPLGRLRQGLETARGQASSAQDYRRAVDQAISQTDQILETFSALLRIAQIDSGSRRARFAVFDLSDLTANLAETYTVVAAESKHVLLTDIPPQIEARGDRELVTQALANLIENAITHTPAGSRIDMTVRASECAAVITVADNGPGVPAAAIDKITQRFYRLETSRTTPGSGLGLSMVAAIADLHGSALALDDNDPGLSVSFRVFTADRRHARVHRSRWRARSPTAKCSAARRAQDCRG